MASLWPDPPGTQWHYGESARVLGEIIEAVSGQELSAFLDAKILTPMHMDDTSYDIPASKNARVVTQHRTEALAAPNMRSVGGLAWAGIFNTEFWIDPDKNFGAVLLMQYLPFYDQQAVEVLQGFEQRIYSNLQK